MRSRLTLPSLIGLGASLSVIALYVTVMTLSADWYYAKVQFEEFRWWIIALSAGLGIQAGLFVFLRREMKEREKRSARAVLAASGGVSSASMAICCLHHLADIVPVLGLPVLAGVLQQYQTFFLMAGVLSNMYGIFMLVRALLRQRLILNRGFNLASESGSCHEA